MEDTNTINLRNELNIKRNYLLNFIDTNTLLLIEKNIDMFYSLKSKCNEKEVEQFEDNIFKITAIIIYCICKNKKNTIEFNEYFILYHDMKNQ